MAREAEARASFAQQTACCAELAAPFTALICTLLGERLDRSTLLGRLVLDWPGNSAPFGDALALRLRGGRFSLRLRSWPGGQTLLAWTHPHGKSVKWLVGE